MARQRLRLFDVRARFDHQRRVGHAQRMEINLALSPLLLDPGSF